MEIKEFLPIEECFLNVCGRTLRPLQTLNVNIKHNLFRCQHLHLPFITRHVRHNGGPNLVAGPRSGGNTSDRQKQ